jgi:hypothetical protein
LTIQRGRLLQWLGGEFDADIPLDDEQLLAYAFEEVYEMAYGQVVKAVTEGFGGADGTFVSLWLARSPDWSGRTDVPAEMFSDIVNAPTSEKLAAYEWVVEQAR